MIERIAIGQIDSVPEELRSPENGRDQENDLRQTADDARNIAKPGRDQSETDADERAIDQQQQKSRNCRERHSAGPTAEIGCYDDEDRKLVDEDNGFAPDKSECIEQIRKSDLLDVALRAREHLAGTVQNATDEIPDQESDTN